MATASTHSPRHEASWLPLQNRPRLAFKAVAAWLFTPVMIVGLGLVFLLRYTPVPSGPDDLAWLQGKPATVFDHHRVLPRLLLWALHTCFGSNRDVALATIFLWHCLNTALVYQLTRKLADDKHAAQVAAMIFMVNPLTFNTLTWIACFSYVVGAMFALAALLSFLRSTEATTRRAWWLGVSLAFYGAGLLSSHELLLLPVAFIALGWWVDETRWQPGAIAGGIGLVLGLFVNATLYQFGRYGIHAGNLMSVHFVAAWLSSAFSTAITLIMAYPLSFFIKPTGFLQTAFTEQVRWIITILAITSVIPIYRSRRSWRPVVAIATTFAALITPYLLRLYLMPDGISYDPLYVLGGRVFYLPFIILAPAMGILVARLRHLRLIAIYPTRALAGLFVTAYSYALFAVYAPGDFAGLRMITETPSDWPSPWDAYSDDHVGWLLIVVIVLGLAVELRRLITAWHSRRVVPPRSSRPDLPRLQQSTICTRRQLLPALVREITVTAGALQGRPGYALAEIGMLADEQLAKIRPIINPQYEIYLDYPYVCSRLKTDPTKTRRLFSMAQASLIVFNLFDGKHSLEEIAQQVTMTTDYEAKQAFEYARHVFLLLVGYQVCLPANPLDESI